ncbi:sigma factor [Polymorphospora rubra]|uniref:sigma factor n=1 Tax=Polymorphospora rubra TaxID=338584 RepID=UPI003CCE9CC3
MGKVSSARPTGPVAPAGDGADLARARAGDEAAFTRLVRPLRAELHAHCYRILGSPHDADDALQDALLRAWRAMPRFEGAARCVPGSTPWPPAPAWTSSRPAAGGPCRSTSARPASAPSWTATTR